MPAIGRTLCHKRLLEAARGAHTGSQSLLRYFPLQPEHVRLESTRFSPSDFYQHLCRRIRGAQRRVHLASLYVGPASDPSAYTQEAGLLDALRATECTDIQILLDQSRALRPVPVPESGTITSAEACYHAISRDSSSSQESSSSSPPRIHLLSVLPQAWQTLLRNPLDEVAGVFHLKVYIVDDDMILSGANLSEEYFTDRVDRYLWIQNGGNGLVDFYDEVLNVLCRHSNQYNPSLDPPLMRPAAFNSERSNNRQMIESLAQLFTKDALPLQTSNSSAVAYAVPTFQAPRHFFRGIPPSERMPTDVSVIESLLQEYSSELSVRVSSAYLNLTTRLRQLLRRGHLLTAGPLSHGFKPKKKAGNKGRTWIPAVFSHLARWSAAYSPSVSLWLYQRFDWTFHSKGMWITYENDQDTGSGNDNEGRIADQQFAITDPSSLCVVVHGSGNHGVRSTDRDMESNLYLVFNPDQTETAKVTQAFADEWNRFGLYAVPPEEEPEPLPSHIQPLVSILKWFF